MPGTRPGIDVAAEWRGVPVRVQAPGEDAFWACRRFSASSNTTDCGPSITSAVTSSPRWAGRQCMNIASGLAMRHQPGVDLIGLEQVVAPLARRSSPIDTQVSVTTQSAPVTAACRVVAESVIAAPALPSREQPASGRARPASPREGEAEPRGGVDPRGQHVVGVADPGDRLCRRSAAVLLEGHDVGHDLAGMRVAG